MKIAVAGATGRVGRHIVEAIAERGHEAVAMSRASGVDVVTGKGLDEALSGVACIIDAASGPLTEQQAATEFFTASSRNLQAAGEKAGVRRIVAISIIGIDAFTAGYMAAKVVHERAMRAGRVPVRILRAAQFHEFVDQLMAWARQGDVIYLPKMQTQLVAARAVAEAVVDVATDTATISEIAGPQPEDLVDAAKRLAARRGDHARIEVVSNAADPDHALYESGGLMPGPTARLAGPTFDAWLATASLR
jgi:uncharacterized protein YbjT (DUF2867 family)